MASAPEARPTSIRIERLGFIADIFVSHAPFGEVFHYVIQRQGSPDIVHWGQETTLQGAKECIEDFLFESEKREA